MPAAPSRQETNALGRQIHDVFVRVGGARKTILAKNVADLLCGRRWIENQISFRRCFTVAGKSIVQQVIENFTVELGLLGVFGLERLQRRDASLVLVSHPNRYLAQLGRINGKQMRLQVEHDLQPVLDLSQKGVI